MKENEPDLLANVAFAVVAGAIALSIVIAYHLK